ncbi:TetR/AcrR family transcriptional regulator [Streptomyces sp. NPDC005761]|uniref:TetR/AcrR family transcriptional regulator n=1 Tax=Streptomyces sp. NPDC005761 TaxID=3157066 RepID=UPI00340E2E9C
MPSPEQGAAEPAAPNAGRAARGPYRAGRARRREILQASTEVFAQDGYRGGSLRDIAGAIGVSPGAILHHFGSKEQLLVAVLEDRDLYSRDTVMSFMESGHVIDGIRHIVIDNERSPGLMRLYTTLAAEAVNTEHPAHRYFVDRYAMLASFIVETLAREGHQTPPGQTFEDTASLILSTIDGLQLQWLLSPTFSMIGRFDAMLAAHGLMDLSSPA